MPEQHTHMTPAMVRSELAGITRMAAEAAELLGLYEDVYADEISEEVSVLLGRIGARGRMLRKQHLAAHERDAAFADSVNADLDQLEVSGDLLEPEPFGFGVEAHDLVWPTAGPEPQTDREDKTADDHDRWLKDWSGTEEDDK